MPTPERTNSNFISNKYKDGVVTTTHYDGCNRHEKSYYYAADRDWGVLHPGVNPDCHTDLFNMD